MLRKNKLLAVIVSALVLITIAVPKVSAAAAQGRITGDSVRMRDKATTSGSNIITTLSLSTVVTINGKVSGQEAVSGSGTTCKAKAAANGVLPLAVGPSMVIICRIVTTS